MVVTSDQLAFLPSNFSVEEVGKLDSNGNAHMYGQSQHQHRSRSVCKKQSRRSQSSSSASYINDPRSRSAPSRSQDSRSTRSRVPPRAPSPPLAVRSRSQAPARRATEYVDTSFARESYVPEPPLSRPPSLRQSSRTAPAPLRSRSQSQNRGPPPPPPPHRSRSQNRAAPPPLRSRRHSQSQGQGHAAPPPLSRSQTQSRGGGGGCDRSRAEVLADLDQLAADEDALQQQMPPDNLHLIAGPPRPRVKGERTANFVMKLASKW